MRELTLPGSDPLDDVLQPVRRAVGWLIVRGVASFAVGVGTLLPVDVQLAGPVHSLGHVVLPGLLAFIVLARAVHLLRARPVDDDGAAWRRAFEVEREDALVAALLAAAVPVAWLVGGSAILFHHVGDAPAIRGAVFALYAPAFLVLWAGATLAWLGDCRERLARAHVESAQRFREYWSHLSRPD